MIRGKGAEHSTRCSPRSSIRTKVEAGAMPIVRELQDIRRPVADVGEFFEVWRSLGLVLAWSVADDAGRGELRRPAYQADPQQPAGPTLPSSTDQWRRRYQEVERRGADC